MAKQFREYKDLDLDFTPHPISGDIVPITGPDAVKRSIRNILLTNLFERPFEPGFGSNVAHLLFEPVDPLTKYALKTQIESAIQRLEPRAEVINVVIEFNLDENRYEVDVEFSVENIPLEYAVSVFLERVR